MYYTYESTRMWEALYGIDGGYCPDGWVHPTKTPLVFSLGK